MRMVWHQLLVDVVCNDGIDDLLLLVSNDLLLLCLALVDEVEDLAAGEQDGDYLEVGFGVND